MFKQATDDFVNSIDLSSTRIVALPQIILVLGGPLSIQPQELTISNRNVFITKMHEISDSLAQYLTAPEYHKEWNHFNGYLDLVEFEKDAGFLSKVILLFSESAGAIAELANFANEEILCDRLVAVFSQKHFDQDSYIKLGPLRQIERISDHSVCVVQANNPIDFQAEVDDVLQALKKKYAFDPKTSKFDANKKRDRFLLLADLLDLFSALTLKDFEYIFEKFKLPNDRKAIERELKLLEMFGLVDSCTTDRKFYVAPKGSMRQSFLNYKATAASTNFDRVRQKTKFYQQLESDRPRFKAYKIIHEARTS